MNADSIKIECGESGFWLVIEHDVESIGKSPKHAFAITRTPITDPEALYDQVKAVIGPWLYERDMAHREYLQDVYDGERQTGQHAPFECDPDEGYSRDDPKHSQWHSVHADHYDNREKV